MMIQTGSLRNKHSFCKKEIIEKRKNMMLQSDFHIHSESSYDATLTLDEIAAGAKEAGFTRIGVTDHVNYNDPSFLDDARRSAAAVSAVNEKYPFMLSGVELTPIQRAQFDYIRKNGTREGYVLPLDADRYGIELAMTKEEMKALGIRYAVGASHWRVDTVGTDEGDGDAKSLIRELFRQQMWLAQDERVTILGHPWYFNFKKAPWFEDFSLIPRSMHRELAAALSENRKCVECNTSMLACPAEKARHQYAEFLREMFEAGLRITFGSDSHKVYNDDRRGGPHGDLAIEKYLSAAGFKDGDFYTLQEEDLY